MTNSLGHESRYYYDKLCNLIQYNSPVVEDLLSQGKDVSPQVV